MYKYSCLNAISKVGTDKLTDDYVLTDNADDADVILVRSAAMHEMQFSKNLLAIARAGAGVNNIPLDRCAEEGIVVFNTPGANANAVKELVLAGMLLASRDVLGGINWVKTIKDDENIAKLVEKGKGKFAGHEIKGKKLGIIGLGAIGGPLGNAAADLGMEVYGCDPYISIDAAWKLSSRIHHVKTRYEIFRECDYITLHTPLVENEDASINTKKMINKETLSMMKDGVVILNFARDILVDDEAMEAALKSGKVAKYVTDFPNPKSANMEGVIAIPHLGASTEEAEDNCAMMAVRELREYLENGNIINSVNYPNVDAGVATTKLRFTIIHKNIPNMLAQFTKVFSENGINIENLVDKSKGDYAYSIFDVEEAGETLEKKLSEIEGVLKVRVISR